MNQVALRNNIEQYQSFVIRKNIDRYTRLLHTTADEKARRVLLAMLGEEKARLKALRIE